jgi:hypothetical protein
MRLVLASSVDVERLRLVFASGICVWCLRLVFASSILQAPRTHSLLAYAVFRVAVADSSPLPPPRLHRWDYSIKPPPASRQEVFY